MISYLQAENITKSFGEVALFEDISFSINKDQKVAIIAKNGIGKTTLLNILTENDTPDAVKISKKNDITIGYLEQSPKMDDSRTVIEQVFQSSNQIVEVVKNYETALKSGDEIEMQNAIEQMDFHKAWNYEEKIKQILNRLKITDLDQKVGELSGGQKKRLAIANLLITEPDLLILDEPTNHLDLQLIEWLEEYMQKSHNTLLMVTHDRYFLDRICNEIIEIDDNTVYKYDGNYSYFLKKREERIQIHNLNVEKAQNQYRSELEWVKRMPKARATKAKYRVENFEKIKEKAKGKIVDKNLELNIKTSRMGKKILELYDISKSYGDLKLIDKFSYKFSFNEKIGIVGNNGSGKTTFLNVITQQIQADSGRVETGETIVFGYYTQAGMDIDPEKKIIDVIKDISEIITLGNGKQLSALQFLEYFLFPTKMHYSRVGKLSGGERRRLYLMTVLMKNPNFLILDEPTNDLDIATLNVLEDYLINFSGCLIVVSHDRYFMDKVVDTLFVLEGNAKIRNFTGTYSEYYFRKKEEEKKQKKTIKKIIPPKEISTKPKSDKLSYKEKQEFEALEKEIPEMEKRKEEIEDLLSSGKLSIDEITEKAEEFEKINNELDEKEMIWLELSERL